MDMENKYFIMDTNILDYISKVSLTVEADINGLIKPITKVIF